MYYQLQFIVKNFLAALNEPVEILVVNIDSFALPTINHIVSLSLQAFLDLVVIWFDCSVSKLQILLIHKKWRQVLKACSRVSPFLQDDDFRKQQGPWVVPEQIVRFINKNKVKIDTWMLDKKPEQPLLR